MVVLFPETFSGFLCPGNGSFHSPIGLGDRVSTKYPPLYYRTGQRWQSCLDNIQRQILSKLIFLFLKSDFFSKPVRYKDFCWLRVTREF